MRPVKSPFIVAQRVDPNAAS